MNSSLKLPSFLHENSVLIARTDPVLARAVLKEPHLDEHITIAQARSGEVTMAYQGILLHSMYDPVREGQQFVAAQHIAEGARVLIFGLGLGYHVRAVLDTIGPRGKVIVLEPNLAIMKAALSLVDMRTLLADGRLTLVGGETEESVALHFRAAIDRRITAADGTTFSNIIIHDPSYACVPPAYEHIKNSFELLLIERRAPEFFERVNYTNIRANLDTVLTSPGITAYAQAFRGVPALFVNAGPSLDTVIRLLPRYASRALVMCCDTALPALVDVGMVPDIVISIDPQEKSAVHFNGYTASGAALLYTPTSAASVVRRHQGPKIVFLQQGHSITRKIEDVLGCKGLIQAGGSVSCMGLDVLLSWGCNPIVFAGMDYCCSGGKLYSSYVATTKAWFSGCCRLHTMEDMHRDAIVKAQTMTVKNRFGDDVPTLQTLYAYVKQVEALLEDHPETTVYNFCSEGVPVAGAEDVMLVEELETILTHSCEKHIALAGEPLSMQLRAMILERLGMEPDVKNV